MWVCVSYCQQKGISSLQCGGLLLLSGERRLFAFISFFFQTDVKTTMTYRLFEGKGHAASYWKYRISPSNHLIQQVFDFLEKHVSTSGRRMVASVFLIYRQLLQDTNRGLLMGIIT